MQKNVRTKSRGYVKFSEGVTQQIVSLIREGISEARICKMDGMPSPASLYEWKRRYPEFAQAAAEARRFSAELYNDRRMELVDELVEKARSGADFPRGVAEAYKAAMQELAREAAIRDDSRFSDRHKVIAEVANPDGGEGMAALYAKIGEAVENRKHDKPVR